MQVVATPQLRDLGLLMLDDRLLFVHRRLQMAGMGFQPFHVARQLLGPGLKLHEVGFEFGEAGELLFQLNDADAGLGSSRPQFRGNMEPPPHGRRRLGRGEGVHARPHSSRNRDQPARLQHGPETMAQRSCMLALGVGKRGIRTNSPCVKINRRKALAPGSPPLGTPASARPAGRSACGRRTGNG